MNVDGCLNFGQSKFPYSGHSSLCFTHYRVPPVLVNVTPYSQWFNFSPMNAIQGNSRWILNKSPRCVSSNPQLNSPRTRLLDLRLPIARTSLSLSDQIAEQTTKFDPQRQTWLIRNLYSFNTGDNNLDRQSLLQPIYK